MNGALFYANGGSMVKTHQITGQIGAQRAKTQMHLGLDGKRKKWLKTENTKASTRKKTKSAKCINPEDSGHLININEIPML